MEENISYLSERPFLEENVHGYLTGRLFLEQKAHTYIICEMILRRKWLHYCQSFGVGGGKG